MGVGALATNISKRTEFMLEMHANLMTLLGCVNRHRDAKVQLCGSSLNLLGSDQDRFWYRKSRLQLGPDVCEHHWVRKGPRYNRP